MLLFISDFAFILFKLVLVDVRTADFVIGLVSIWIVFRHNCRPSYKYSFAAYRIDSVRDLFEFSQDAIVIPLRHPPNSRSPTLLRFSGVCSSTEHVPSDRFFRPVLARGPASPAMRGPR